MGANPYEPPKSLESRSHGLTLGRLLMRFCGGLMLAGGFAQAAYIAYRLLVQQPATDHAPVWPAVGFCMGLFYVGSRWVLGKRG